MTYSPRIFVHAPYKPDPTRALIKAEIIDCIKQAGFSAQEFSVSGIPAALEWSFDHSIELKRICDGALIIALGRLTDAGGRPMPSEFSHFEGALALFRNLPTLVVREFDMQARGILSRVGRNIIASVPVSNYEAWISNHELLKHPAFVKWSAEILNRRDVFFGYSSAASKLAQNIKRYLESTGLKILDWSDDFRKSHTILEEVQNAARDCRCGLFLLTADHRLAWSRTYIPNDNVLLETGFFLNSAGRTRTTIVKEPHAKIPSDLDGIIYQTISSRTNWKPVADKIAKHTSHPLGCDDGFAIINGVLLSRRSQ